jgi:transcriptional regulator with XRE-family HTH domain
VVTMSVVNGNRLRQAREICGYSQAQLGQLVGVDQAFISYSEQDYRQPSQELLERIAFTTGFPPGFFTRSSGPEFALGSLLFRRRESLDSTTRDGLRQMARVAYEIVETLAVQFGPIPVHVPRLSDSDPVQAATLCRSSIGLRRTHLSRTSLTSLSALG